VLKHAGFDFKIRRPKGWRGQIIRRWLWPEQAWRIIDSAYALDAELGLLCMMLLFGGLRISEQLAMTCDDVPLDEAFAFVPHSKNGEPQPVHLTPYMIEKLRNHPGGLDRPGERLFRFHEGGGLDFKLIQACAVASGLECPKRAKRGSKWPQLPPYDIDWVRTRRTCGVTAVSTTRTWWTPTVGRPSSPPAATRRRSSTKRPAKLIFFQHLHCYVRTRLDVDSQPPSIRYSTVTS
jgi:hypothetical protein